MTPMLILLICLGVLLAILVVLLIYRSTLEMHEDDQLFLTEGESQMAKDQQELQRTLGRVEPAVRWLGALSGVILLAIVGMWI
jgi:Tfp pilus assembly protein PilN